MNSRVRTFSLMTVDIQTLARDSQDVMSKMLIVASGTDGAAKS